MIKAKNKTIMIITKDEALINMAKEILMNSYRIVHFDSLRPSLNYIYNSMPDLLIIAVDMNDFVTISALNEMRNDPIFGKIPVLAIVNDRFVIPAWNYLFVDDYLKRSSLETDMLLRVNLCIHRAEWMTEINPLTRLPGNITIMKQVQKKLDANKIFALAYADIDRFKPYNDKYGFSRGDEVLRMLGRLILNKVKERQPHSSFVGHIGGDDFIFVMNFDLIENTSKEIIGNFNEIILSFYDAKDKAKNYIESINRNGNKKIFPLMSISVGIVHNKSRKFSHYSEIAGTVSEMKKHAKHAGGGCFMVDKRSD